MKTFIEASLLSENQKLQRMNIRNAYLAESDDVLREAIAGSISLKNQYWFRVACLIELAASD